MLQGDELKIRRELWGLLHFIVLKKFIGDNGGKNSLIASCKFTRIPTHANGGKNVAYMGDP